MKTKKLFLAILTVALSISCSSDDDTFDFSGTYNLTSMNISSSPRNNYIEKYNLNTSLFPDDNCLGNSNLEIFPNGVAVLKLTSNIESRIQIVEGSEDDLEHVVTCEPIETIYNFIWMDGSKQYSEPNGRVYGSSSGDYKTIRLIDANGIVRFMGFFENQNSLGLGYGSEDFESNISSVEVQGDEIEFSNLKFMTFAR